MPAAALSALSWAAPPRPHPGVGHGVRPAPAAPAAAAGAELRGSFDGFTGGKPCEPGCGSATLIGWAVNASLPGGGAPPVNVSVTVDGAVVVTQACAEPRPDLVSAGVAPNPEHGCLIALPAAALAALQTGSHAVAGFVAGPGGEQWALPSPQPCMGAVTCKGGLDTFDYLDNGVVRVGIDITRGASIGYIADSKNPATNLINAYDMGREVQLSYYGGPSFYNPPTPQYPGGACDKLFGGKEWPWNPIGAGDVDGNHGAILSLTKGTDHAHIVTRPLQWACHNVSCECTFEQNISLDTPAGTGVRVDAVLHNQRSDKTAYPAHDQELPAVYTNGPYNRLVSYSGSAPFTQADTIEYNAGWDPSAGFPWLPGHFPATESWAAMVDTNGFGLGVVSPATTDFLGGFSGKKGPGGTHDNPTGYIAPTKQVALPWDATYAYTFWLVLGDVATIRSFAYQVQGH